MLYSSSVGDFFAFGTSIFKNFHYFLEFFADYPAKLQQLVNLPLDAPLWVQIGKQDELAEAELKYIGPLTRGSSAVIFGVQLKVDETLNVPHKCNHFIHRSIPRRKMALHVICAFISTLFFFTFHSSGFSCR